MVNEHKIIENDMADFRRFVHELSQRINNAGYGWKDAKYETIRENISRIAGDSKSIIQSSERCKEAINRFIKICSED